MNIIVTGASKGLGLKTTEILLQNGDTVYAISRTKSNELTLLEDQYKERIQWLSMDLDAADEIRERVFKDWIGFDTAIHGFVNNAAMAYDDIITNLQLPSLEKMFSVNVYTPMGVYTFTLNIFSNDGNWRLVMMSS